MRSFGLDVFAGQIVDNVERGVLEPAMNKIKALGLATEAATAILRIDDFIRIAPKQQEGRGGGMPGDF